MRGKIKKVADLRKACLYMLYCVLLMLLFPFCAFADPEPVDVLAGPMPMLVNRRFPVDDDFVPSDLVLLTDVLDSSLIRVKYKGTQAVRTAAEALEAMLEAAKADGVKNWQVSAAYRSIADQEKILEDKIRYYRKKNSGWSRAKARSAALHSVAEPGCSEHHLGLAFDVNVPNTSAFKGTKQCKWLHAHCWDYGFIVRYQENKEEITGFTAEEWHIRYVGVEHAQYMRDHDMCLEEYLLFAQDNPDFAVIIEEIPVGDLLPD